MGGSQAKEAEGGASVEKGEKGGAKKGRTSGKKLLMQELDDHEGAINVMQLSDDGSLLVTGGEDKVARMWSTKTEICECLGELEGHSEYITCIAIIDTYVLTGSADNTIRKWDMPTCNCMFVYIGHENRVNRIICTGELIFSTSYDKTARLWIFEAENLGEANADKACIKVYKGHSKGVYPMVYIPADGVQSEVDSAKNSMKLNPADLLITGSADCTARSWSVESAVCLKVFEGHTMPIMCMAVEPGAQTLMTAGGDSVIRSWELRTGRPLKEFVGHNSAIIAIQVVNRMLYSCSCDQTMRSWVIEFGDCTRVFKGHEHSVTCAKYADGMSFTGCGDGVVRIFDAKSGSLRQELKGHQGSIAGIAIVDGRLYSSCVDGKLRVFDVSQFLEAPAKPRPSLHEALNKNNVKIQELDAKLDVLDDHANTKLTPSHVQTNLANAEGKVTPLLAEGKSKMAEGKSKMAEGKLMQNVEADLMHGIPGVVA